MRLRVETGTAAEAVDAVEAYAYTGGKAFDPSLPCVVFIHGALHDHSVWNLLARSFAAHGHAVLAVDLPGHGRSKGAALTSVEALADRLLACLDAAGIEQASLVGHSMGSLIALEAASRAPERVSRLVMIGTAYPMVVSDALFATAREDPLQAIDMVNAFSFSSLAGKPSFPGPGMWLQGSNRALMRRVQAGHREANLFLVDFEVCNDYTGGVEAAARVRCPTTLILGEHDQMTARKQAAAIGNALHATTVTLAAGHALMAETPEAVRAAVQAALA